VPRGRHAPPLEVRQTRQRGRLFAAASAVFARLGYADATAEAIAREAGMSKATFYEHFANKEECIIALFDVGLRDVLNVMREAADETPADDPRARVRVTLGAFLATLAEFPDDSQTLLVEIVGAGPRAMEHRDRALEARRRCWPHPTTRTRSPAPWSSSPRGRSAPACRRTSGTSSRSSSG